METTEKNIKDWLHNQIDNLTYGKFYIEITPSGYDDKISSETVLKYFNEYMEIKQNNSDYSISFNDFFQDKIIEEDWVTDSQEYLEDRLYEEILLKLDKQPQEFRDTFNNYFKNNDFITDILEVGGYQGYTVKAEDFLQGTYNLNLMFATPSEKNVDMGAIDVTFEAASKQVTFDNINDFKYNTDNALTYLIHQQGHTLKEVFDDYKNLYKQDTHSSDNNFIKSVSEEVYNMPYSMSEVTALVSSSGKELLTVLDNLANKKDYLSLPKNTMIGLFNEWNGSGAPLEIECEKDIIIPCNMIRNVQMETSYKDKENEGYTVNEVYGLISSCWNSEPKIVKEEPKLKEENLKKLYSELNKNEKTIDR